MTRPLILAVAFGGIAAVLTEMEFILARCNFYGDALEVTRAVMRGG